MILSNVEIFAQKVKNVLVIPFERFEMHSKIKLDEINKINGLEGDKFYENLILGITEAFEIKSDDRISYQVISEEDWKKIKSFMDYGVDGSNSHYACLIDSANMVELSEIIKEYYCDYLLTLNCYKIEETKASFKLNDKKKVVLYSAHYVDFDFFTPMGYSIYQGSNYEIEVEVSRENFKTRGLYLKDLRFEFPKMVEYISNSFLGKDN